MSFVLLVLFVVTGVGSASAQNRQIQVTPFVEVESAPAGSTIRIALEVALSPELHAQSDHPAEPESRAMRLIVDAPGGVKHVDVAFPPSKKFQIAGFEQPSNVFVGTFLIGARIAIGKDQAPGTLTIPGGLYYQACNDTTCFSPKTVPTSWTVRVTPAGTRASAPRKGVFDRIDFRRSEAPPKADAYIARPAEPVAAAGTAGLSTDVLSLLDKFEIADTKGGYLAVDDFLQFIKDAESGVKRKGLFEGQGPIAILAIVFLGGLALNLTPCVLPMIPINLAIIGAGAQSKRKGRGFVLGAAYGGAMAIVYGVLGLIVILTAGTFGTINASVWFNAGIAALFVVLGLAMFDVIAIDFTRWSSRIRFGEESRGSVLLAFSMGAVAALLAGACVAPVVIQVVVFASNMYAGGTAAALALPFVLGLGMALPWPIAGAGMAKLPKPGAWMVRVKQVMGVFILGTAVYYGYLAYEIASARWVDPASVKASVDAQLKEGWYAVPADGLQAALRDRKPVLIDFWATWCKNCLVMDKTTLQDARVKTALNGYTKVKYQAEDPDASPAKEVLQKVGGVGLPTYVVLKPR